MCHSTQPFFFEGVVFNVFCEITAFSAIPAIPLYMEHVNVQLESYNIFITNVNLYLSDIMQIFELIFCNDERDLLTYSLRKIILILYFKIPLKLSLYT